MAPINPPRDGQRPFRLGELRALPALHRLEGPAGEISLEPKAMRVLAHLAAHAERVVGTQELLAVVWEGEHVSEEVARRAIYTLRKALEDDPKAPRYIETIPRAGYRLVCEVEWETARAVTGRSTIAKFWPGAILLLLVVAASSWKLGQSREGSTIAGSSRDPSADPRIVLLTAEEGLEWQPALSPDGSRVAFIRRRASRDELVVRLVETESELRLARDAAHPAFSPGGERIAFLRRGKDGCRVMTVPSLGGPERTLADLGPCSAQGLAFSPDERFLVVGASRGKESYLRLLRLDLGTGSLETLTEPPPEVDDYRPSISPDARQVAFLRNSFRGLTDVYVVPIDGGEERRLTAVGRTITDIAWEADGESLLMAVYESGDHRLWRLPATAGVGRRFEGLGEGAMEVTADLDGSRLAYSKVTFDYDLHHLDLASGDLRPLDALSSTRFDGEIAVSPDGQRLAFASTRSGDFEIWISDRDGGRPNRLTALGGSFAGQPRWSPDGRTIVFVSAHSGDADLYAIDVRGGLPRPLTSHPAQEHAPHYSRDGETLHFASTRSGRWEIWSRRLEQGAEPRQLTRHGGFYAIEDPTGTFLYFVRPRAPGLYRIPAAGGEEEVMIVDLSARQWGNWLPVEDGVFFVAPGAEKELALWFLERSTGARRRVAELGTAPVNGSLTLGPDGNELLFSRLEELESDLVVVETTR